MHRESFLVKIFYHADDIPLLNFHCVFCHRLDFARNVCHLCWMTLLCMYTIPCDETSLRTHETNSSSIPCSIHVSDPCYRWRRQTLQCFSFHLQLQLYKGFGNAGIHHIRILGCYSTYCFQNMLSLSNNLYFEWMCTWFRNIVLYLCAWTFSGLLFLQT